jgi:anaerobic selenocysteine-containing dehydrogenase
MDTLETTCPLDCPDTCALEVTVDGGRVTAITGSAEDSLTAGYICSKVRRFPRRLYGDDRVLYPLQRSGPKGSGRFERIGWDEALSSIARRLSEVRDAWGGEAILPYHYGGSNGFLSDGLVDDLFFARLGASRLARTLCAANTGAVASGMYGKMPGVAFEDYPEARCIVVWGANPKASNIHLAPYLKEARRRGAFVAAVDPIRNFSADEIDLHLPIYPGSDLPVALAMIRYWEERGALDRTFLAVHASGLEALLGAARDWTVERAALQARLAPDEIRRLADTYAAARPALVRIGWGPERNRNGGGAIAAIMAIPALLGKFGARGGGYTLSNGGAAALDKDRILGALDWNTRELNMTELGRLLTDGLTPPVKALFVYNCNPAATVPDQNAVLRGLAREDLYTVVHEQVLTDTALYADVVLPATTFLEHYDVRRGYGNYVVGGVRPVIEPCGEAKPNHELFAALGRELGMKDEPFSWSPDTLFARLCAALEFAGGRGSSETLARGAKQRYDFPGEHPVQFGTVFPKTSDGRVHLAPASLGPAPFEFAPVVDDRFPLALVSPSTPKLISSTLGEFNLPELRVTMNPRDAAARGIGDGERVSVHNELGEVVCRVAVDERIRPGVVSIPKGAWRRSSQNGATSTALCPGAPSAMAGAACFNDARVEVARC